MPHDIFRDVVHPPAGLGSQTGYTVPLSILTHVVVAVILVIVPLVATDVMPEPSGELIMVAAPPVPDPPPPPIARRASSSNGPTKPQLTHGGPTAPAAPTTSGDTIADEAPGPPLPPGRPDVGPPGDGVGTPTGGPGTVGIPTPPPPPGPVRAGGMVKYPEKVRDVRPIYPQVAVAGRVEGRVIIEAIIGSDGRVKDARILRSIPLLDRAALDAVQQWHFTPTLLNGVPVPVIITVTVDFKLH